MTHETLPEPSVPRTCPDRPSEAGNVYIGNEVVPVLLNFHAYGPLMIETRFEVTGAIRFETTTLLVLMYGIVNVLKFISIVVVLARNVEST